MMSIQLKIWKRLITNQLPLSCHRPSLAISLLPSIPLYANSHTKLANFCNQMEMPSTTPPNRGVVSDFLISKCGLADEDITKGFRHYSSLLRVKSTHNLEQVLELLKGCGLTTPAEVRTAVLRNPQLLFSSSESIIKPKLSFLRTFIKEEDMCNLVLRDAIIFRVSKDKLKSAISLLQRLGVDGEALSYLVVKRPRLLLTTKEKVIESFQLTENLGIKKGSKLFAYAVQSILGLGKEKIERRLHCLSCLGFSEKQISVLARRYPQFLGLTDETLKRKVDFMVNTVGLPLATFVSNPCLFNCSLENRIIPRYRVMEALKSMQGQELKIKRSYTQIFKLTDKQFFEKYVNENAKSSILHDIYHGGKTGKLMIDKETRSD